MRHIATITHDVNGIRINCNGVTNTWANQSWLAESHAQLMVTEQELQAKLKDIRDVVDGASDENLRESLRNVLAILNRE